jgi:hypothetical protein
MSRVRVFGEEVTGASDTSERAKMIALEIHSNGERICTVCPEGLAILSAAATWLKSGKTWDFRVRGITDERGYEEHLNWMDKHLSVGDTVTLKVVETEESDKPCWRYRIP